jgi:hypothetical protein
MDQFGIVTMFQHFANYVILLYVSRSFSYIVDKISSKYFQMSRILFLKYAGELCIIVLKRGKMAPYNSLPHSGPSCEGTCITYERKT